MIDNLLKIFSNYTRSLEILYLLDNIKETVRLDSNDSELKKIKDFCNKEKLQLEVSDFKLIKIMDKGKGGYANIVKRVPVSNSQPGLKHIYISKDKNKSKFLKILENKNDDSAVGEVLGYPECCVDFFIKNKEKQQKLQNDYILPALKNSDGFKFHFYTNYAVRYFDITLLSHFPHSFNCENSITIANENLKIIKNCSKELANNFESMLKSAVLYTENQGIFVFRDYKLKNNILHYNEIKSTIKNDILELLNKNKKLEIIDKNQLKIGNKILNDIGFMVFT